MRRIHLNKELKGGGIMDKDIKYINEDIEDAYDANIYIQKITRRNRSLVRWTKLGEVIHEKTKRFNKK